MANPDFLPIDNLILVYQSETDGEYYEQPATDLLEAGTLIEPEGPNEGDDMDIVGYRIA